MGVPVSQAESVSAPTGTATTITITLPTHQEDDLLIIQASWKGIQAPTALTGWTNWFTNTTGTATNGCGQGVWWRRVAPSETVSNPTLTIGTTAVERRAIAYCIRGADIDNPANTFWLKQQTVGNSATPTPPALTTLAPNYLLLHLVTCRGNSAVTPPTGYNEEQDSAEGTTICAEGSTKTQATATTVSGQAASISSNRWVAAIVAIPSPDYPYFRAQTSQTATATSITGTLPTNTTAADFYGRKDLIIATVEAAGTAPTPNVGADWTEIATWTTTTSGGSSSVAKYWALYDGSISLQFNRSGSGEISLQLTTYRNPHQTTPIGAVNVQQNASSTTSTWNALTRTFTKSTVQATCIADGVPTYTSPAGWTERADGNGISAADQIFEATGSTASASFTLSTASPTATGLVEVVSHAGAGTTTASPANASLVTTGFAAILSLAVVPQLLSLSLSTFAPTVTTGAGGGVEVTPSTQSLSISTFAPTLTISVTPAVRSVSLSAFVPALAIVTTPAQASVTINVFAPTLTTGTTVVPTIATLTSASFAPALHERLIPSTHTSATEGFAPSLQTRLTPSTVVLIVDQSNPSVTIGTTVVPNTALFTVDSFVPSLSEVLTPITRALSIPAFAPTVTVEGGLSPPTAALSTNLFAVSLKLEVKPTNATVSIASFTPTIQIAALVTPATLNLTTQGFVGSLAETIILQSTALAAVGYAPHIYTGILGTYVPDTAALTIVTFAPGPFFYYPRGSINIAGETRTIAVESEDRTIVIPAEDGQA